MRRNSDQKDGTQTEKITTPGVWRFLVDMWMEARDRAKLPRADRGYALFQRLKDIKQNNFGNKLVTAAQLGTIDVFSEDRVGQILEVLDKRFKRDQLAYKKKKHRKHSLD